MDYVSLLDSEGVSYIAFNFENCEQIIFSSDNIRKFNMKNIQQHDDCWEVGWLDLEIDNQANGYYTTLGYDPKTTSFNRILFRHDIVSMEMHKNTGDVLILQVAYQENEKGYNDAEKTYIDKKQQLHIEIGEKK